MFELSETIVFNVFRATIGISVATVIGWTLLRMFRIQSPQLQRIVWFCVLAQGWVFYQISLPLISSSASAKAEKVAPSSQADKVALYDSTSTHTEVMDYKLFAARDREPSASHLANAPETSHGFSATFTIQSTLSLILLGWASGIVLICIRFAWNYRQFLHQIADAEPANTNWSTEWEQLVIQQGVQVNIPLLVHDAGPLLCRVPGGYRLLVPRDFWNDLDKPQRRAILQHELAHYRRRDLWKSLAMRLLMLPHWFNPCAWLAVRRFDESAELACDDAVRQDSEGDSLNYAQSLLTLLRRDRFANTFCAGAGGHCLATRIKRLVTPSIKEDAMMKRISLLAVVVCCSLLGLLRIVAAEEPEPVQAPTPERQEVTDSDSVAMKSEFKIDEAYIDLNYIFKHNAEFTRRKESLAHDVQREQSEMKKMVESLKIKSNEIKSASGNAPAQLEKEVLQLELDLKLKQREAKAKLLWQESQIYEEVFERIQAEVANYAREHGIRVVRRLKANETKDYAKHKPVEAREIIQRINADVIYQADERVDITQPILERLNKQQIADESSNSTY